MYNRWDLLGITQQLLKCLGAGLGKAAGMRGRKGEGMFQCVARRQSRQSARPVTWAGRVMMRAGIL